MDKQLVFDVGVNDGDDTAYYLNRGYKVVGIEADPLLVEQLSGRFAEPIARGDLLLLNLGVADEEGEAQFWVSERSIWSSFSRDMASRDGLSCHPITVPTKPQNSISVCQSRPLRARRDASMANTAPTRPSQIAASSLSNPGRLTPEPERPRSSSMTVTSVQPRARARSARPY